MQRPWGKRELVQFQELKAGQCDERVVVKGERTIFRALNHSHFIAGSHSTSWNPFENTVLVPFFRGCLKVEKVRWLAEWVRKQMQEHKEGSGQKYACWGVLGENMPFKTKMFYLKKKCELFLLLFLLLFIFPFRADFWLGHILDLCMRYIWILPQISWLSQATNT